MNQGKNNSLEAGSGRSPAEISTRRPHDRFAGHTKGITLGGYNVYVANEFAQNIDYGNLINIISQPPQVAGNGLSGRASIKYAVLPSVGEVAIKYYIRGGVFGRINSRRYLKFGPTRGEAEFNFLREVRALGVNAPQPVAYIDKGRPFYIAWLVTLVIPRTVSLAELSLREEERASRLLLELVRQIAILIKARIWHVDLHPGNVLVDEDDNLHILDFDKAVRFSGSDYALRDRYLFRWRRAAIKHKLPEILTEMVCLGLRSYHGEQSDRLT